MCAVPSGLLLMNSGVSDKFITEFASSQMVLHAYILFLVGGVDDSKDILQEWRVLPLLYFTDVWPYNGQRWNNRCGLQP